MELHGLHSSHLFLCTLGCTQEGLQSDSINRKRLGNFCNYVGRIRFSLVIYLQMVLSLHTVIEMLSGKPGQVSNSCEQGLGSDLMDLITNGAAISHRLKILI